MSFFKKGRNSKNGDKQISAGGTKPVWGGSLPGKLYKNWPKVDGTPEEPVFLKHCTSADMEDEMLINMLAAYGIPAVKQYPLNGSFGKVVLGMSGEGTDIFVPASMLEDAIYLIGGC
ncbi:MAG: hypothetical protein GX488_02945 [Clostridiales bacterium]|nr:hypothetical protein [Clostridiales bacterium]